MTKLTTEPIDVSGLMAEVSDMGHGGQALFVGTVRDEHEGRRVTAVTYEAFEPLAAAVLSQIARDASRAHGAKVAVVHRLGKLPAGQASVAIAASSAHRAQAFSACRDIIEEIKKQLPVWKKEHYEDGESAWLAGCELAAER
ncbi:MAG: molybdenum cofactor biosynthesis protein MoaE [Elusimicrobia bacterium]|nr:molybdenum cofactor biosynthesis protein MoaE [Elusimicrobiota bacterium]